MAKVREYRRTCLSCGKVWHSLVSREKQIAQDQKSNKCAEIGQCCNPSARLQARRNVEAGESELSRLKRCPECQSGRYKEEVV